jgi:hypothetical protein
MRRDNDRNHIMSKSSLFVGILILVAISACDAGQQRSIRCRVTYCTSAQIYFDGGKEEGLSVGDTLVIARGDTSVGSAVITGISSHSSVSRALVTLLPPRIGDIGTLMKEGNLPALPPPVSDSTTVVSPLSPPSPPDVERKPGENVLAGRVAFQYIGQYAEDSRLNINQPSLYANMKLENLGGTGMSLSLYGREYYDIGGPYLRYGDSTHSRFDLSELSLGLDRQTAALGFSAGRFISRYVTAIGALDGGELFVRQGHFTAGAIAGAGVQSRVMGIGGNQRSVGGFLAYHQGESIFDSYDASAAYVRQTVGGNLDRAFLSVQNSIAIGTNFNAYGSADVELKEMTNGVISSHPFMSSLLVFVNYVPTPWLSTNLGYDGTRSVYLFESMKGVSDSLFHEALNQGFRLNGTIRLGMGYTLTTEASVSSLAGDGGSSHTLGAGIRVTDIFSTRVFGSLRFRNVGGSFLNGSQSTIELGRNFFQHLDILLQYDSRSYSVDRLKQTYTTQTFSGNANFWISRNLYGTLGADYVLDNTMNGFQYFLECGYRF